MGDPVYLRAAPPFPFGVAARAVPRAFLLYRGVDPLNLGSHEGKGYLLKTTAFDPALTVDLPGPPFPFGTIDRRTPRYLVSQGRAATTYPAATGNAARSSANDDTPAATWVPGKMSGGWNYEVSLFGGGDPTAAGTSTIGVIQLYDPDGELDDLRTLSWDGAVLELLRGDPDAYYTTYETVAKLSTAGLRSTMRVKEILLRDLGWKLQKGELHGLRYGGTGGLDGDAPLRGKLKPYCIGGPVPYVTPAQIVASVLCYQVSCSSVRSIAAYDGGAPLTLIGDYPTYDDLAAATIAGGSYATCLAEGIFRVGASPALIITATVEGDADTIDSHTFPSTRAEVARRIVCGRGNLRLSDPDDLDLASFVALASRQTGPVGFFWGLDQQMTKAAALDEVMKGCLGWWTVRLNGRLAIGQLEDPATVPPLFSLYYPADDDDNRVEYRVDEPSVPAYLAPRRTTLMGWARNYTVHQSNQIAGILADEAALLQQAGQFTTSNDPWTAAAFPTAPVVQVDGNFVLEDDAQVEGDRQQRLLRRVLEPYDIPAVVDPFGDYVGHVINVRNSNRLGLGSSRNLFCYGVSVNANAKPILHLVG